MSHVHIKCKNNSKHSKRLKHVRYTRKTYLWVNEDFKSTSSVLPPLDAEFGGQVSPVAIGNVRVFFEEEGDLFVRIQSYPLWYQHRPVLVTAQLYVVGSLQQLLWHFEQHLVVDSSVTRQAVEVKTGQDRRKRKQRWSVRRYQLQSLQFISFHHAVHADDNNSNMN